MTLYIDWVADPNLSRSDLITWFRIQPGSAPSPPLLRPPPHPPHLAGLPGGSDVFRISAQSVAQDLAIDRGIPCPGNNQLCELCKKTSGAKPFLGSRIICFSGPDPGKNAEKRDK